MEDYVEVYYPEWRWRILKEKRSKAIGVMNALAQLRVNVITHGSIARGDVDADSDVDIVIVDPIAPLMVEVTLQRAGYKIYGKEIIQATPSYTPKVYLYLDYREEVVVSYPLAQLKPREREFYRWGGEAVLEEIARGIRKPGVNKELRLIVPTEKGHVEYPVIGREAYTARILGVSLETVMERVRVLTRRRIHGRTGVFLKVEIDPERPIEEEVDRLSREIPAFRRALRGLV
ncbi:MAG: nucleotidyltransferase domain-containing protein [Desulfurococcales archaeon]|nr:nucleotidyltransferase domain-containing protein [Desulfurococcales archaeon]